MKSAKDDSHALELFNASLSVDPELARQYVRIHPTDSPEGRAQVERVARVLMQERYAGNLMWEEESEELRRYLLDHARAAIDALKEGQT